MKHVRWIVMLVAVAACGAMMLYAASGKADKSVKIEKRSLPLFVDLGADRCHACKAMVPVLEKLKQERQGQIDVKFIDVWENRDAGIKYNIRMIPTQIFFAKDGKELWRHVGFISNEDIDAKLKELGYAPTKKGATQPEKKTDKQSQSK